jgi:hypothetical protein
MSPARATALAALSLLALTACDEVAGPRGTPCTEALIPNAFAWRWERTNHRVSELGFTTVAAVDDPCSASAVRATFVGGDFTTGAFGEDLPALRWQAQRIVGDGTTFAAATIELTGRIEPGAPGQLRRKVSLRALGLDGFDHVTALIGGLHFTTTTTAPAGYPADYSPELGYTSRGLRLEVAADRTSDDEATISAEAWLEPGTSPDRDDLNRAVAFAAQEATVQVLLIGTQAPPDTGSVDYTLSYAKQAMLNDTTKLAHASAAQQQTGLRSDGPGVVGFSALRWELAPTLACDGANRCDLGESCTAGLCSELQGPQGYYLRELSVSAAPDGSGQWAIDGYATNEALFAPYDAMVNHFTGSIRHFRGLTGEPVTVQETTATGTTDLPLP